MSDLNIDTLLPPLSEETIDVATEAERLGFDGAWSMENSNDGYLPHVLAAEHTTDLTVGTRIALSFTRSPMVTAQLAWDLARYSNGRFVLGLGTQVKGHNERRFSVDWDAPGPRLRETIESIRHIWDIFQGEEDELSYEGDHYSFSLMSERFNPGPIANPDIPVYIGGFNEYNLQLAGELADGLAIHPFGSQQYVTDVIMDYVETGAVRSGRDPDEVSILVSPLTITGETEAERDEARERVRRRVAFYGSTRTYHDALAVHGWKSIGDELHELSKEQRWDEMAELITDEMLAKFSVEAPPDELVEAATEMYSDVADRVVLPFEFAEAYMQH
ncbi:TIGR03617 family F420-dependent LLM class oxidoreductase [Natronorubrum sp. FCH18a]|uniref:TIGR03617 family F420-dependent LLM class oxidoreductase n=1 Tax=Natronorubrum sp. FCH18a TaxID=3447018 RepID=UPI003F51AA63